MKTKVAVLLGSALLALPATAQANIDVTPVFGAEGPCAVNNVAQVTAWSDYSSNGGFGSRGEWAHYFTVDGGERQKFERDLNTGTASIFYTFKPGQESVTIKAAVGWISTLYQPWYSDSVTIEKCEDKQAPPPPPETPSTPSPEPPKVSTPVSTPRRVATPQKRPTPRFTVKKAGPRKVFAGRKFGYKITVRNTGKRALKNVRVVDVLPRGIVVEKLPKGVTVKSGRLIWNIKSIGGKGKKVIRFRATTLRTVRGKRCNRVIVKVEKVRKTSKSCMRVTVRKVEARRPILPPVAG